MTTAGTLVKPDPSRPFQPTIRHRLLWHEDLEDLPVDPLYGDTGPCGIKRQVHDPKARKVHVFWQRCKAWKCAYCMKRDAMEWWWHLTQVTSGRNLWKVRCASMEAWQALYRRAQADAKKNGENKPSHVTLGYSDGRVIGVITVPVPGSAPMTSTGWEKLLIHQVKACSDVIARGGSTSYLSKIFPTHDWSRAKSDADPRFTPIPGPVPTPEEMREAASVAIGRQAVLRDVTNDNAWWHIEVECPDLEAYQAALAEILARRRAGPAPGSP